MFVDCWMSVLHCKETLSGVVYFCTMGPSHDLEGWRELVVSFWPLVPNAVNFHFALDSFITNLFFTITFPDTVKRQRGMEWRISSTFMSWRWRALSQWSVKLLTNWSISTRYVMGISNKNGSGKKLRNGWCQLSKLYSWTFGKTTIVHFLQRFSLLKGTFDPHFSLHF